MKYHYDNSIYRTLGLATNALQIFRRYHRSTQPHIFVPNKEIRTGSIGHCWVHTNDLPSYRIKRRGIVSRRTPGTSLSTHFYPLSKSLIRVHLNITDGEGGILLSGYIPNTLRGKPKQIRARPWKILDSIICVWAFFVPIFEQDTGFFFASWEL